MAKGLTNGAVPMGAVVVRKDIYDAFMTGAGAPIELFHGYTYSAHPLACAAGAGDPRRLPARRACSSAPPTWRPIGRQALHSLKGARHVIDIRNLGLIGAIELEPRPGEPGTPGPTRLFVKCLRSRRADPHHRRHHRPVAAADHREGQIDRLVETMRETLQSLD